MAANEPINKNLNKPNTGIPLPLERFYHWEKKHPNKTCFTQPIGDGKVHDYTWGEVANQVRRIAAYLQGLGLEPGDKVAILSKNCAQWIMSDIAIWMAGYVSVPLYPTLNARTIKQILEHSESKVLFVGKLDDWESMQPGVPEDVKCISYPLSPPNSFDTWNDIIAHTSPLTESPSRGYEDLATIIYTSGTTGMPKGVMHSFGSMGFGASQVSKMYEVRSTDRMLSYLPLSHVAERVCVEMLQIYEGTHLYFAESLDTFVGDIVRARPTIFFAVPRIWTKFQMGVFAKLPEKRLNLLMSIPFLSGVIKKKVRTNLGLNHVRFCFSGAAPISDTLLIWYKKLGLEVLEVYGMTENMGYSHANRSGATKVGSVGQPNPSVEVKFGDGNEILVRSPATMLGYYKAPKATDETLDSEGYIHTGDVGQAETDGSLRITGRIKEIFKTSKGKYIAPAPIENKLMSCTHIEQICVVGADMTQPLALVMLSEADREARATGKLHKEQVEAELKKTVHRVNEVLDPHEQVKTLVIVKEEWSIDNGILTPTLKIKRNVLESHYEKKISEWFSTKAVVQWEQ